MRGSEADSSADSQQELVDLLLAETVNNQLNIVSQSKSLFNMPVWPLIFYAHRGMKC